MSLPALNLRPTDVGEALASAIFCELVADDPRGCLIWLLMLHGY